MASNMSQLEEVEENTDKDQLLDPLHDENLIVPRPHYFLFRSVSNNSKISVNITMVYVISM